MKLIDTNLVIYAYDSDASQHEAANEWLEAVLSGVEPVAFPWTVILGFVRIMTSRRIYAPPLDVKEALDAVDSWLAQPCAVVVHPTERHPAVLRRMLEAVGIGRKLTMDAHLAALSVEHNADLCSADADFARFPGVRWVDPLSPG
jgi:toxin-antitoxin system PIN domain toxin